MNVDNFRIPLAFFSAAVSLFAALVCAVGGEPTTALGWSALAAAWTLLFAREADVDPRVEEIESDRGLG